MGENYIYMTYKLHIKDRERERERSLVRMRGN